MFERKVNKSGTVIQPDPTDPAYMVVASVSGGKDSTALCLWLKEQGIEHRRVCMDTGWEHPDWRSYVEDYLQEQLGPIEIVQSERGGMVDHIRRKGIFPSRLRRWCTEELKLKPFHYAMRRIADETGREPISAVGVRADESKARSTLDQWDFIPVMRPQRNAPPMGAFLWRPLIRWSVADVIAIHQRHDVRPNPIYLRGEGVDRVGCWPCIHSSKKEIRMIAEQTPERVSQLRDLEREITKVVRQKIADRGEVFEQGERPQAWFYSKGPFPIDAAVDWARTSRGGKQYEMFASTNEGCMRWGMCDGVGQPGRHND